MADSKQAGFVRISQLMVQMMDAVDERNKERLIKLTQHFAEDTEDLVGVLLLEAGVTDEDMMEYVPDDEEELVKEAANGAWELKTAVVKE